MISELLAPYRARIDAIDEEIVALLGRRYAIVAEVATLKAERGIPSVLPDRVDEVLSRVRALATAARLEPDFVVALYEAMIRYAHAMEDKAKHQRKESAP